MTEEVFRWGIGGLVSMIVLLESRIWAVHVEERKDMKLWRDKMDARLAKIEMALAKQSGAMGVKLRRVGKG